MGDKKSLLRFAAVIIAAAAVGYAVFMMPPVSAGGMRDGYQAVFLVNNQVYFGKLSNQNAQFPVLKDIYYLQVNQPIQPVQTAKGQPAPAANPEINLVKLGGELHGPTDEMRINRDQILLVEDLRTDSNLVKAIDNYKARQTPAATPAQ
jgi:hypothetical protein